MIDALVNLLAQAAGGSGGAAGGGDAAQPGSPGITSFLFPILLMFGIMWFLVIRPKQKEEAKHRQLVDELKKGDRVYTYGGIIGKVMDIRDREIVLKVDDGNGTRIHFVKGAVKGVLRDDDDKKDDKDRKDDSEKPEESKAGS